MKLKSYTKTIAVFMAISILLTSCASSTLINSEPGGAKIYLNDEPVGVTPYKHRDNKIVGTSTDVRLEKEGYETLETYFTKDEEVDVGAIIGGVFFLFPFLWTMKYKPSRTYEMTPLSGYDTASSSQQTDKIKSKAERLRELKKLLDEDIITQAEYDSEKKKILEKK